MLAPKSILLRRFSSATSVGKNTAYTVSTQINNIIDILKSPRPIVSPVSPKNLSENRSKAQDTIIYTLTNCAHLIAAYRESYADVLSPNNGSRNFDIILNDDAMRRMHNRRNAELILLENALQGVYTDCRKTKILDEEQLKDLECVITRYGVDLMIQADSKMYALQKVWRLLRYG